MILPRNGSFAVGLQRQAPTSLFLGLSYRMVFFMFFMVKCLKVLVLWIQSVSRCRIARGRNSHIQALSRSISRSMVMGADPS